MHYFNFVAVKKSVCMYVRIEVHCICLQKATQYSCADEMFSVVEGKCKKVHYCFHPPSLNVD